MKSSEQLSLIRNDSDDIKSDENKNENELHNDGVNDTNGKKAVSSEDLGDRDTEINDLSKISSSIITHETSSLSRVNDTNNDEIEEGRLDSSENPNKDEDEKLSEEELVDILSKNQTLISMVEKLAADVISATEKKIGDANENLPTAQISRSVVQSILTANKASTFSALAFASSTQASFSPLQQITRRTVQKQKPKHTSRLKSSSRSRSHSPHTLHHPPVKTVSFSSISTPQFHNEEEVDQHTSQNSTIPASRSPQLSPPVSLPSSPPMRGRTFSTATNSITIDAGEITASGDSSVSSSQPILRHSSFSSSHQMVHFSALNPNPQLILESNSEERTSPHSNPARNDEYSSIPRVSFNVSFQDQPNPSNNNEFNSNNESRNSYRSRSGLSSPSIEPALSPPIRSRNRSSSPPHIHFNSTIETITEAAHRLRSEQNENRTSVNNDEELNANLNASATEDEGQNPIHRHRSSSRGKSRMVHFSAFRRGSL